MTRVSLFHQIPSIMIDIQTKILNFLFFDRRSKSKEESNILDSNQHRLNQYKKLYNVLFYTYDMVLEIKNIFFPGNFGSKQFIHVEWKGTHLELVY